ncbi:site-specific integrase [Solibacillus merdavium]|uniref:Arm DNA-binding domain-containing protein n=1 Tax=Solibacillus merdavium TaxID=2762218 RepID=A0ABR8XPE9_9BACL|nr:site-specific integrase [Solibacillus merdavium]MBD8033815.1 Arm DNA-binding domain-containing protein [Solibacillus merdavium]
MAQTRSSIKSYKNKKGETLYMFRVYLGINELTGKPDNTTRRGFKTKREAEHALTKIKFEVSQGTYKSSRAETFQDVYDLWIIQYEKTVEESTFVKTIGYFKNHILPSMGNYRIEKITIAICQKHFDEWAGKVKKARTIKAYAKKVLDFAIVHGYLATNPFTHVETKVKQTYSEPVNEEDANFYTKEELTTFLNYAELHLDYKAYTLLRLISYTGMRKSEALALTWNDLNLVDNELRLSC